MGGIGVSKITGPSSGVPTVRVRLLRCIRGTYFLQEKRHIEVSLSPALGPAGVSQPGCLTTIVVVHPWIIFGSVKIFKHCGRCPSD